MYFECEEYEVWIVGDLPDWIQNVNHIPHAKDKTRTSNHDATSKLKAYLDSESPEKFIRMYDDICFVGARALQDLEITRYRNTYQEWQKPEFRSGGTDWRECVDRTLETVKRYKGLGLMTETHCPEVFEKARMKHIFEMFDPWENRLLTSTLYYNMFPFDNYIRDLKTERAAFYGYHNDFSYSCVNVEENPKGRFTPNIEEKVKGKYFLNYSNLGLGGLMQNYLKHRFPNKSKYER